MIGFSHEDTKMSFFDRRSTESINRCDIRSLRIETRLRRGRNIFVSSCEPNLHEAAA